jgi:trimethylamine:corrinoid methyltransferase-like protein
MTRQDYTMWQAEGAKDINQRIRQKLKEIEQFHEVPSLSATVLAALERVKRTAAEEEARRTD